MPEGCIGAHIQQIRSVSAKQGQKYYAGISQLTLPCLLNMVYPRYTIQTGHSKTTDKRGQEDSVGDTQTPYVSRGPTFGRIIEISTSANSSSLITRISTCVLTIHLPLVADVPWSLIIQVFQRTSPGPTADVGSSTQHMVNVLK